MALDITEIKIRDKVTIAGTEITSVETTLTGGNSALPRADAVKAYVDSLLNANDAMQFKGTIGTGGTVTALPTTHSAGWTYRVITAETYAGVVTEVGDLIIAIIDRAGTGNTNSDWTVVQTNIDGAVIGPSSSTSGNISTFNGTSGKLIQDSGVSFETTLTTNSDAKSPTSKAVATYVTGLGYTTNTGTVTSVGLALPNIFSVSDSPVTTSGTLTGALANQNANIVFAGPGTGSAAAPTFRALVANDIPNLDAGKITTGTLPISQGGTGATSVTQGGIIYGSSTSAYASTAVGTAGQVLTSNGTAAPTWSTISGTGTVTSVGGTGTVSGLTLTGTVTTSGNLTLGGTLAVTASNFASQSANTFLAAPNGTAGVPTFRTIVAADVPTLNQNTTGTSEVSNRNIVFDVRDTNKTPAQYNSHRSIFEFNNLNLASSTWWGVMTVKGWDGNYAAWQLAGPASVGENKNDLFFRGGQESTWGDWRRIYHSGVRDITLSTSTGGNFGNRLIVGNTDTSFTLQDTNLRPTIQAHGAYPVLSLNHTITSNTAHGPTIQFTSNGTGNQFVIGTTGNGSRLDIGTSSNSSWNPHNGIADYLGITALSINTGGNVGINTISPSTSHKLDVNGETILRSWLTFNNNAFFGLYSPNNGAHFYPNNATYGAWRVAGSRNGWGGIEFDSSAGGITMMVSSDGNTVGWHHNNYGWQTMWQSGTFYVNKNTYGGGTQAVVLDSANYNGYAPTLTGGNASGTWAISITGDANTVDGQNFSYSNNSNSPTYLWATDSNGSSYLAARGSISVNYANSAGSAGSTGSTQSGTTNGDVKVWNSTGGFWNNTAQSSLSVGSATRATDANEMRSNFSTATFSLQSTTFGTMTGSNFNPISVMSKSLGSSTRYWLGVWTCTIYRTSESTLSDVYSKKDIKNIIIDGVPVYQPELLKNIEVTQEEENFFEGVKTLFEKLTIYTYNHIGSETNQPSKIGVMAQEIEEVLESYPLLLSLLIEEVSEDIKDENDNVIDTKITKYLRTDNLDTLKTIMIKYIYFKVKNLEEAVKQANETIAKIKTVLVEKFIATEGELQ
jgi:hypothetical protein